MVAHGRVCVASSTTHSVAVINPRTTRRVDRVQVPPHPHGVTAGAGDIWVTGIGPGTLDEDRPVTRLHQSTPLELQASASTPSAAARRSCSCATTTAGR